MAQTLPAARESVVYDRQWQIGSSMLQGALDITGYGFKLALALNNVATVAIPLAMASTELGEGFAILSGPNRMLRLRILAATLTGVSDTTGDFNLFGDLLARPPGGEWFFVQDVILPITKGPTNP